MSEFLVAQDVIVNEPLSGLTSTPDIHGTNDGTLLNEANYGNIFSYVRLTAASGRIDQIMADFLEDEYSSLGYLRVHYYAFATGTDQQLNWLIESTASDWWSISGYQLIDASSGDIDQYVVLSPDPDVGGSFVPDGDGNWEGTSGIEGYAGSVTGPGFDDGADFNMGVIARDLSLGLVRFKTSLNSTPGSGHVDLNTWSLTVGTTTVVTDGGILKINLGTDEAREWVNVR